MGSAGAKSKTENPSHKLKTKSKEAILLNLKFPTYLFEEKDISDFICPICKNVPNPHKCYEITCCGSLFCTTCILDYLEKNKICPSCKKEIESKEKNLRNIEEKSKMTYRMILKLNLKCPYNCDWKGSFAEIENHFKTCSLKPFECKYKKMGCNFNGSEKDCEEHEKNISLHLNTALEFVEKNPILANKKKVQFDKGNYCKVSCHEHVLKYMKGNSWDCKGNNLSGGCCSGDCHFETPYRFRCKECNFDLCNLCLLKYAID